MDKDRARTVCEDAVRTRVDRAGRRTSAMTDCQVSSVRVAGALGNRGEAKRANGEEREEHSPCVLRPVSLMRRRAE